MVRFISFILSSILLASCATTQDMKIEDTLLANEGIAVTRCKTPNTIDRHVDIFSEDYKFKFGELPPNVQCSQEGILSVIKLKAGKYYAGYTRDYNQFKHLQQFTIQPNKINYIGDIRFASKETNVVVGLLVGFQQPQIHVSALDKKQETLDRLSKERPDIAGKYEVVSSILGQK